MPVNLTEIGWFLLAGLVQPAFGFIMLMKAFERVGVARTAAIMGTSPLFGVSIAVLFLGERPSLSVAVGTVLIALGVILLSLEEGTEGAMRWKAMSYPFLTALMFGLVPVLRKFGLNHIPSPLFGMTVASFSELISLTACARMFPAGRRFTRDTAVRRVRHHSCGIRFRLLSRAGTRNGLPRHPAPVHLSLVDPANGPFHA